MKSLKKQKKKKKKKKKKKIQWSQEAMLHKVLVVPVAN